MKLLLTVLFGAAVCAAQITPIQGTDSISGSRTTINNNFSWLVSQGSAAVNVKASGAVGDGVTDDSTAILAAASAVNAAGGGEVVFPGGTFVTGSIPIYNNVHYRGAGELATIIKLKAGANADVFAGTFNGYSATTLTATVIGATNASPIVLSFTQTVPLPIGSALSNVVVTSVGGNTAANGTWNATVTGTNQITLTSSTGNAAWTSGGSASIPIPAQTTNIYAAANSGATTGNYNFTISDLTIDGNGANQTAPSSGVRVYGYNFSLHDMTIRNTFGDCLASDWNTNSPNSGLPDGMEAKTVSVKLHNCGEASNTGTIYSKGAVGIRWAGPNDSQFNDVIVFWTSGHGVHVASEGYATVWSNCHIWGVRPNIGNLEMLSEAGSMEWTNVEAEGSEATQVALFGGDNVITGGKIFGAGNITASTMGIQIGQASGGTPYFGSVNQSGGLATSYNSNGNRIDTTVQDVPGGAFNFQNDGGDVVTALIIQDGYSPGYSYAGSPNYDDNLNFTLIGSGTANDGTPHLSSMQQISASSFGAFTVNNGSADVFNINTAPGSLSFQLVNGTTLTQYSDGYSTKTFRLDGTGTLLFGSALDTTLSRKGTGILGANGALAVGESTSIATIASSGTISVSAVGSARVTETAAVTGVIMGAGTVGGQIITVVNEGAFSITMAAKTTSRVLAGTAEVIAATSARQFIWDDNVSAWAGVH
jgi:hypothetical protein